MPLLKRLSSFMFLRRISRDLGRIADALERAYPKPVKVTDYEITIDDYAPETEKTESDDLEEPEDSETL